MAISRLRKWGAHLLRPQWQVDDSTLDVWIRDAFVPDRLSSASPSAWERLRSSIVERGVIRGYGMWMLDEPQREPPDGIPGALSDRDFHRALRLHDNLRGASVPIGLGYAVWSTGMNPNFLVLMNW